MKLPFGALLVSVFAFQQAAATWHWPHHPPHDPPHHCSDAQKHGFDWRDLPLGGFHSWFDFDFAGFVCKSLFGGRKAIEATLDKGFGGHLAIPRFFSKRKGFVVASFEVSLEVEVDVDFIYTMRDGSTCVQTEHFSPGDSMIENKKCGGAVAVGFKVAEFSIIKSCKFKIRHIDFHCPPQETPTIEPPTTPPPTDEPTRTGDHESSTTPCSTESSSTVDPTPTDDTETPCPTESSSTDEPTPTNDTETPCPTESSTIDPTATDGTETPCPTESTTQPTNEFPVGPPITSDVSYTISTVYTTTTATITRCPSAVPSCPGSSTVTTVTTTIPVSTTICPITETPTEPSFPGPIPSGDNPIGGSSSGLPPVPTISIPNPNDYAPNPNHPSTMLTATYTGGMTVPSSPPTGPDFNGPDFTGAASVSRSSKAFVAACAISVGVVQLFF